jgi:glycosyltransferase involved in cell wall biosynthesis
VARRILVVTYPYPPMPSVGGNRWLAMAKYLRRFGHEVSVLTTDAFGTRPSDADEGVERASDLIGARWLRFALRRPPLPVGGAEPVVDKPPPGIVTRTVVPDPYAVTWVPFAASAAARIVRSRAIDCVVTTSAYESTHLVALALGRRRPAWIADFRDGWTYHPWKPDYPLGLQRDLDRALERKVVRTAERVVVVERPVGDDFRDRLGVPAAYVPNGWDPELAPSVDSTPAGDGRVTIVHTGRLSGGWGRSPEPLLDAMVRLDPSDRRRLRLVLAGRLDSSEQELLARYDLGDAVSHVGHVSRDEAMALQRGADALLLITSPDLVWELPAKVFEYIGARRPVLALASGNEAARVVEETGIGWTVHPRDVEAIADALRRVAAGELSSAYAPRNLERFVYPRPAESMADEVELAIERRRRLRG